MTQGNWKRRWKFSNFWMKKNLFDEYKWTLFIFRTNNIFIRRRFWIDRFAVQFSENEVRSSGTANEIKSKVEKFSLLLPYCIYIIIHKHWVDSLAHWQNMKAVKGWKISRNLLWKRKILDVRIFIVTLRISVRRFLKSSVFNIVNFAFNDW